MGVLDKLNEITEKFEPIEWNNISLLPNRRCLNDREKVAFWTLTCIYLFVQNKIPFLFLEKIYSISAGNFFMWLNAEGVVIIIYSIIIILTSRKLLLLEISGYSVKLPWSPIHIPPFNPFLCHYVDYSHLTCHSKKKICLEYSPTFRRHFWSCRT